MFGGNRKGTIRTYVNIMIVFLVSGIWHGANWTFIVWGVIHGIANVLTRILDKTTGVFSKRQNRAINVISWFLTFVFVNLAWVIFRADSLTDAWTFFTQFFRFTGFAQTTELLQTVYTSGFQFLGHMIPKFSVIMPIALFVFAFAASVFMKNTHQRIENFKPSLPKVILTPCILVWSIMSFAGVSTFLYWNF